MSRGHFYCDTTAATHRVPCRHGMAYDRDKRSATVPALASETDAPQLEAWAGLRPFTPDELPLIGSLPFSPREFAATGHFRNGILLAPATARVIADLLENKSPAIDLTAFSPHRFNCLQSTDSEAQDPNLSPIDKQVHAK